jgi:hypothetical protein
MKKLLSLAIVVAVLSGCAERTITSFGQTSDGRSFRIKQISENTVAPGYNLLFTDGVECQIPISASEWISGQRQYRIICTDDSSGKASVVNQVTYGGKVDWRIDFTLDNGVYGRGSLSYL